MIVRPTIFDLPTQHVDFILMLPDDDVNESLAHLHAVSRCELAIERVSELAAAEIRTERLEPDDFLTYPGWFRRTAAIHPNTASMNDSPVSESHPARL